MDVIYIKWVDTIVDDNGWRGQDDTDDFFDREDNVVEEVGFVWSEDEDFLHLVSSYMPGDNILTYGRTKVPKRWILERVVLMQGKNESETV